MTVSKQPDRHAPHPLHHPKPEKRLCVIKGIKDLRLRGLVPLHPTSKDQSS